MAHLPTGETHHVWPVPPEWSLFRRWSRRLPLPLALFKGMRHYSSKCTTSVAFEGFVLYAGGDYALILNTMLLVQVMAYVMSGMFAADIVGRGTCHWNRARWLVRPSARFGRGWEGRVARESVGPEFLKRPDVFVNMGINQDNVNC